MLALVVPRAEAVLDGAALIGLLKTQLAAFKVPKQIVVLNELPRNAMGKVQKNLLRKEYKTALLRR